MQSEANFQRGYQLFEIGRFSDAITYFKKTLSEDIDHFEAKFYLAQSFLQLNESEKAKDLIQGLIGITPNYSGLYFLLSKTYLQEDDIEKSLESIEMAISLDPHDEDSFGQKSYILLHQKKYEDALYFADEGLKLNAKSRSCLNARATALTKLKRKEETKITIEHLLNDDPENAFSHANVGWSHLENNNIEDASLHFKEALKLDPNSEYARDGMLTTIKAKNRLYNLYLRYSFWISNKSDKHQWMYIIGIYLVYRLALKVLSYSGLTILTIPLVILYLFIALGTWIMEPLSNTILLFDKFGRYLLSKEDKLSGQIMFSLMLISFICYLGNFIIHSDSLILISVGCLAAILPLSRSPLAYSKKSRLFGYAYGILILVIACAGSFLDFPYNTLLLTIGILFVAYTWLGNLVFH